MVENGKIALYTIIINGYDTVPPLPASLVKGVDCFLVTDNPDLEIPEGNAWIKKVVKPEKDPHRHQRRLKLRFHELFPDYGTVVYVDANIHLKHALQHVLALHKGKMTTCIHPHRRCVYAEAEACERLNKAPVAAIRAQAAAYRAERIPENFGMYQTGFIIRSNTQEVRDFCEEWFSELNKHTHRDQLSIMPVIYRTGFDMKGIPWNTFTRFATLTKHASGGAKYAGIHYLTPYAADGNIGLSYNIACSSIPGKDDWIILRDGDTSFCSHNWGRHIEHVLKTHGNDYQLFGAVTNRIRSTHQRAQGMFDEFDMREHWKKGLELERDRWGEVVDTKGQGVAGFFMAFRKSTWEKTPFREHERTFDTLFSKDVKRAGGKIGLMAGVYLFHFYRPLSSDPINDIKHLDVVSKR